MDYYYGNRNGAGGGAFGRQSGGRLGKTTQGRGARAAFKAQQSNARFNATAKAFGG